MAKLFVSRLADRLNLSKSIISGGNYRILMQKVLSHNMESIARATTRLSVSHWKKSLSKVKRTGREQRQFIIPDLSDTLPKRSILFRKSAEQGDLIVDSLRDQLTKNLRDTISNFTTETGEQAFTRKRGKEAGTMNPKLTKEFEKQIVETFSGYTKRDPKYGVPPNVHTIAVTETTGTVNDIKDVYMQELINKNPDLKATKEWIQNRGLSKEPRIGHSDVHLQRISINDKFLVPMYEKKNGKWMKIRVDAMDRPYDPNAPLDQVIGCHCGLKYYISTD